MDEFYSTEDRDVYFTPIKYTVGKPAIFKSEYSAFMICESGSAIIEINYRKYNITTNSTILISYTDLISRLYVSTDFKGYCLAFSPQLVSMEIKRYEMAFLIALRNNIIFKWGGVELQFVKCLFNTIVQCAKLDDGDLFRKTAVNQYFCYINFLNSHFKKNNMINGVVESCNSGKKDYFQLFIMELHCSYRESREVLFYANSLNISSNYLNEVCQSVCEHSAKEVIDNYVSTQLKYELYKTDKSMQELADEYHFPNQSYLSRYYRRNTGETPSDTRRNRMTKYISIF